MNKEVKQEKSKAGVIYTIIALIVVIVGGVMLFKSNNTDATAQKQKNTIATKVEPKEEKTIARIDIITKLVDAEKPQFEVYVDGSETPLKEESWMPKYDKQGVAVLKEGNVADIIIKPLNEIEITFAFRGPDKRNENNEVIEKWVDYNTISVNGKNILSQSVSTWLNKPFYHVINAKAGEEYKIHAEWTKEDTTSEK